MTGRVKDHFHDEICAMADGTDEEPDILEMLAMDAHAAIARYKAARKRDGQEQKEETDE